MQDHSPTFESRQVYIDGYNLLFRMLHAGEDLRTQREALIKDLQKKVNLLNLDVTLVFDSHYQPDESSRSHIGHLAVVYTALGETADEYILQELKESRMPAAHVIVTSDKKLAWLCRRHLGKTESVEEFVAELNKRYKNKLQPPKAKVKDEKPLQLERKLIQPPARPPIPQKNVVPQKRIDSKDCFDYYLQSFEKELDELSKKESKKAPAISTKRVRKCKPPPVNSEAAYLSDMERWEKAFGKENKDD